MFPITGISAELILEGVHDDEPFAGRVIAIALEDDAAGPRPSAAHTWFLVADDRRPSPIWVSQNDVSAQRLGR
jgi:hypothetical protein